MSNYKRGVENVPLKNGVNECPIYVIVRNLKAAENEDDVVQEFYMNLSNPDDRKHLGRVTYWAVTNGHSVETMNKNDAEGNG
jgi:hypothetical protein